MLYKVCKGHLDTVPVAFSFAQKTDRDGDRDRDGDKQTKTAGKHLSFPAVGYNLLRWTLEPNLKGKNSSSYQIEHQDTNTIDTQPTQPTQANLESQGGPDAGSIVSACLEICVSDAIHA